MRQKHSLECIPFSSKASQLFGTVFFDICMCNVSHGTGIPYLRCPLRRGTYRLCAACNSRRDKVGNARRQSVATDETSSLISSEKVEGTAAYSRQGEKLGSIPSVMIDKISGKVAYAVMSFGGFPGIGDRYHPLPWHVLTYDTGQGG
jgi:PRC-barrel domain